MARAKGMFHIGFDAPPELVSRLDNLCQGVAGRKSQILRRALLDILKVIEQEDKALDKIRKGVK